MSVVVTLAQRLAMIGLLCSCLNVCAAAQATNEILAQRYLNDGYEHLRRSELLQAIMAFQQAVRFDQQNVKAWLELGYALSSNNQRVEAIKTLQRALNLAPTNVSARSQLGYLLIKEDRIREAIETFLFVEQLEPNNFQFKLQLGYLYDRDNDKERARVKFLEASQATDPEIKGKAQTALKNLAPVVFSRRGMWANELYAAPLYQSRFNNLITPFIARSGVILTSKRGLESYLSLRLTRDTRSIGGSAPQIFSDNVAVTSIGLRARPFRNALTVYGEAGLATNLARSSISTMRARSDFRAGAYFSRSWGKRASNEKLSFTFNPVGDVYLDASYYSRFRHNFITYLQAHEGLRILQAKQTALEAYGRLGLAKDTGRDFYNNIIEGALGAGVTPYQPWGAKVTVEYVRGRYLSLARPREPNPYGKNYGDVRVSLIFGKYFVKE